MPRQRRTKSQQLAKQAAQRKLRRTRNERYRLSTMLAAATGSPTAGEESPLAHTGPCGPACRAQKRGVGPTRAAHAPLVGSEGGPVVLWHIPCVRLVGSYLARVSVHTLRIAGRSTHGTGTQSSARIWGSVRGHTAGKAARDRPVGVAAPWRALAYSPPAPPHAPHS
jgi:hypothetical protein